MSSIFAKHLTVSFFVLNKLIGWLSPELYLRRPPAQNEGYRLDRMLQAAAQRGVSVRIMVYKEVAQVLTRKIHRTWNSVLTNTFKLTLTTLKRRLKASMRTFRFFDIPTMYQMRQI